MGGRWRARVSGLVVLLVCLLALAVVKPAGAEAHALVVGSDPAAGSSLTQLPKNVTVTFSEEPAAAQSSLVVVDGSGGTVSRGPTSAVPGNPLQLRVAVGPLLNGVYTVRWHAVSSDDGHASSGSFTFGVGPTAYAAAGGPAPALVSAPSSASAWVVAGHWIFYVGVGLVLGGSWILLTALPDAGHRPRILTLYGGAATLAGLAVFGTAQAHTDGISLGQLPRTSLGLGLFGQAVPALLATLSVAAAAHWDDRTRRRALSLSLLACAATMLVHALTTHAASARNVWLEVSMQWLHLAAFAAWIGGLAVLLVAVGTEPSPAKSVAVRRFSRVAAVALAALLLSGVLRALADISTWHALLDDLFGRLVLIKVGLVALLIGLGAWNRFVSVPAAGQRLRGLRRVGAVELGVAGTALIAAAVLTASLPPALSAKTAKQAPPPDTVVHSSVPGISAVLDVGPGYPGLNRFTLTAFDATTHKPVGDAAILHFAMPARTDVAGSTLTLEPAAAGGFTATGGNLTAVGDWTVIADLEQGSATVSIPFQVPCALSPQLTEEMTMGRMAMAYGIALPGGRRLDAYLTPGHSGANTVHLVFTDAAGGPTGIRGVPAVTVVERRISRNLTALRISYGIPNPNTFYAATVLPAGSLSFHVQATADDGTVLIADFALTVS